LGFAVETALGGLSLWCRLPERLLPSAFHRACIRAGVGLRSGEAYAPHDVTADSFAIDFGRLSPHILAASFQRLAAAARKAG
jgi:DNA-binding transcriptional MocR family regulator